MPAPRKAHEIAPLEDTSVAYLRSDGFDQAKCKRPRELALSTEFEKAWRPQLHVVVVLLAGVLETYYILEPGTAADSNMEMTLIMRAIDLGKHVLAKRRPPRWKRSATDAATDASAPS